MDLILKHTVLRDRDMLFENKEYRNLLAEHFEVLERVKTLILVPNTTFATIKQVADYYEVNQDVIRKLYQRNKEELEEDGVSLKTYKEILKGREVTVRNLNGKTILEYSNGKVLEIPNRGITIFPRRAILRVGMLLRDSPIAKEVRTQLLNIEEKISDAEQKIEDINEEEKLMLEVGKAMASGDVIALTIASTKLMDFKNRHIKKLEEDKIILEQDNKLLTGEILTWSDRNKLNAGIRKLSKFTNIYYSKLWNELYKQLKYKYSIDVKARANKDYIKTIKESEWECVSKSFSAICEKYNQSPTKMIEAN